VLQLTRRQMVQLTGLGAAAIGLMLSIPAIGFLLSPLVQKTRETWVRVGAVPDLTVDQPKPVTVKVPSGEAYDTTPVDRIAYLVRKSDGATLVLTNTCSHMQCDVHFDPTLQQFLCPCHGGLYDVHGNNIGGPPPSPLPQWVHRFEQDSQTGQTILFIKNAYDESI